MKKLIAGAAIVTSILTVGSAAFAETTPAPTDPTAVQTTTSVQTTAAETTTTAADTTTTAPATETTTTSTDTTTTAPATETTTTTTTDTTAQLPDAGITPDQFLYKIKVLIENLRVVLTRDAADRAALLEQQAQTRLAEAKAMADEGKLDLAQQAMIEAQAKLEAAQQSIESSKQTDEQIAELAAKVEADQDTFVNALNEVLAKLPEDTRLKVEPTVAEIAVQVAALQDAAKQDEAAKEEAEKAAEEADLKEELSALQPRMVLVLNSMAKASGKSLAEVFVMYQQNPGLGRIAKELGLKMGAVQHAAQIDWKKVQKDGYVIDITSGTTTQTPAATQDQTAVQPATEDSVQVTLPALNVEVKAGDDAKEVERKAKENGKSGEEHGKSGQEHGKSGEEHGNNGKGKN